MSSPEPHVASLSGLQSFVAWLGGSLLASAVTAWLAFQIRLTGHAPEVLFPIGVGLALGLALVAVLRKSQWPGRRWAMLAAVLWGTLAVLGQEYLAHREHRGNYQDVQSRPGVPAFARLAAAEMPPPGLLADLAVDIQRRGHWQWSLDALAVIVSATMVTAWKLRVISAENDHPARDRPAAAPVGGPTTTPEVS